MYMHIYTSFHSCFIILLQPCQNISIFCELPYIGYNIIGLTSEQIREYKFMENILFSIYLEQEMK